MKSIIRQQTESTIRTAVQYLLIAGSHHEMRMRDDAQGCVEIGEMIVPYSGRLCRRDILTPRSMRIGNKTSNFKKVSKIKNNKI